MEPFENLIIPSPDNSTIMSDTLLSIHDFDNPINSDINNSSINLVFINSDVKNYQTLVNEISPDYDIFMLNSQTDGIEQISNVIANYNWLDSIHFISHGQSGLIKLGNTILNQDNLALYQDKLSGWSETLNNTGDILLYGCSVAADEHGRDFVETLSEITGAEIAASTDLTGNRDLGGDGDLEYTTGEIEASLVLQFDELQEFNTILQNNYVVENDPNFNNEVVVSGLSSPTSAEFLPDGRALILEKDGRILITNPQDTVPTLNTYLTLPDILTTGEKGLIDIALDPDFSTNNYIYLYYTLGSDRSFQISRFEHQGNTADLSSEVVIWKDPNPASSPDHFGGGLNFGPDGKLYLTTGDKGLNTPQLAQDLTRIEGSILRINKDGSIPEDNPFFNNTEGYAEEIWAYGLRNPFRSSWDFQTNNLYIGDVGLDDIEEVNRISVGNNSGVNFGWPLYEGSGPDPDGDGLTLDGLTNPIYEYAHTKDAATAGAVIGGFVYRGNLLPQEFQGAYFFGDFTQDYIKYLKFDGSGNVVDADTSTPEIDAFNFERFVSGNGRGRVVDDIVWLGEAPDGALYYLNFKNSALRRITYNDPSGGNLAPVIDEQTTTATFVGGTTYEFNAVATDPDGDTLDYLWDFGDGNQATGANVTHAYASNGQYTPTLVVSDGQLDDSYQLTPIVLGTPPTASINLINLSNEGGTPLVPIVEPDTVTGENRLVVADAFRAGDTISFEGIGADPDGTLSNSSYSWDIKFLHDDHFHPEVDNLVGSSGTYDITTTEHGFSADLQIGFEFVLTVTDSDGLSTETSVAILPEKVDLTFNDNLPGPFQFTLDSVPRTSTDTNPFVLDTAINFQHNVVAQATVTVDGINYLFDSWSTGETTNTLSLAAPETNQTYIANYIVDDPNPDPEPPVAEDDSVSVTVDSTDNLLDVLANDTDPDPADTLTIFSVGTTDNGGIVGIDPTGDSLFYTPAAGFVGTETFTYTVEDSSGLQDTATVSISVVEDFAPPVTNGLVLQLDADSGVTTDGNGLVTAWEDQSGSGNDLTSTGDPQLIIGALNGNNIIDLDGDGDTLQRLSDITGLPSGNGDRTVFVVANYNSNGNGGFTYGQASRGKAFGLVVDENGNLGVQAWGNANDQITTEEGTGQGWLVQSVKLEAGTLTQYKNGTFIDSDPVSYNTTLNQILLGVEIDGSPFLNMGIASVLVFDRALSEAERQQVENYLQQRYFGSISTNNVPNAVADTANVNLNSSDNPLDVLANDTDPDADPLTITGVSIPDSGGSVEINTTNDGLIYTPATDFSGTETFTYNISDGKGGTDTSQVTVEVAASNNTIPNAVDNSFTVDEDSSDNLLDVLANDSDPDSGLMDFSNYLIELDPNYNKPVRVLEEVSEGELAGITFVFDATEVGEEAHFHLPGVPTYLTQHNSAGNGAQVNFKFARQDGLPFAFESFDYTSGLFFDLASANAGFTVIGTLAGRGTISQTFGPADTLDVFQTATLNGTGWKNVTSVQFLGDNIQPGAPTAELNQELNLDNLVVGSALSITTVSATDNGGTVTIDNNELLYTPVAGFNGAETFTYTIEDSEGASDTATVTVTVDGVNDTPVAVGDSFSIVKDSRDNFLNVLDNDNDPDGEPLTIIDLTEPDNGGVVTISPDGTGLIYTPAPGFTGTETFTYNVQDPSGASNPFSPAAVSITINAESALPVTNGLVLNLDANNGVTTNGSLVTNWNDQSGSGNDLTSSGDPQLIIGALNGNNIIDLDGDGDSLQRLSEIIGLPSGNSDRTVFLVANYNSVGNGGFTYGQAKRGKAFGLVVDENGNLGVQAWGNANDQITTEAGTNQGWLVQSVKLAAGTLTQYKNGTVIDSDSVNYNTTLNQILLGAEIDGSPNLDMSVASVLVFNRALSEAERQQVENYLQNKYLGNSTGGNSVPVAVDDTASTDQDIAVNIDVLANDIDGDGNPLSLSITTLPTNGTATVDDNGTVGDLSDDFITYSPDAGFTGSDSLTYEINDGNGGTAQANVAISVVTTGGNSVPVAVDDTASTDQDIAVDIDVLDNDSDGDGDPLSLSITTLPTNGTATVDDNGTVGDLSDDFITYSPDAKFTGSDSLTYEINDGNGGTAQANVAISVRTNQSSNLPVTNGLVLNLDADSGVTTNTNGVVVGWTDGSGLGNDLTSTGNPQLITGGLNGRNIINFDGDGDSLQRLSEITGLPSGNSDRTLFLVANYNSVGNGGFTYGQPSRGKAFGLVVDENGNLGVQAWGNANDQITTEAGTNQGWLVQSVKLEAGTLTQYKNGTVIDTDSVNYNTTLNQILLGAEIDGSPNLDMSIASLLVFDRALSETERQQVENYLQQRYFGL